ncbi:MAG: hypothetical protein GVY29_00980 [Spirochaetes bacterium]|jgi:hypothetical protein|nr:hypothetical protein [Spirochaetota bacterium]
MRPFRIGFAALLLTAVVLAVPAQNNDFQGFRQLSTEHFTFVYEPRDRAAVNELVAMAEEVYRDVTELLEDTPEHTTVLVVGRTDQANGYFSSAPPQHIALFVAPMSGPDLGTRHADWLRLVFVHEFTHHVHINYQRGFFQGLGKLFGDELVSGNLLFMPFWNVEGITTSAESLLTRGGRGKSAFFEMSYKAPAMEGELFNITQAGYQSHLPPSGRFYVGGYLLIDHIIDTYGTEVYLKIHHDFLRFPFLGIWGAIRRNTGDSATDILRDIERKLEERYGDVDAQARPPLFTPERVSDYYVPIRTGRGLISYRGRPGARGALVHIDLAASSANASEAPEATGETLIAELPLTDGNDFSATADGGTIVISTYDAEGNHPAGSLLQSGETIARLYTVETATGATAVVPNSDHLSEPAISPNGDSIVAVERMGTTRRLVRIARGDAAQRSVVFEAPQTQVGQPVVSPTGTRVAFTANRKGEQEIAVLPVADTGAGGAAGESSGGRNTGPGAYRVPGFEGSAEFYPRFVSESELLFSSDRSGSLALYRHDLESGETVLVLEDPVGAYAGVIHDGSLIYGTYSSLGWALRATPTSQLQSAPVPSEASVPGDTPAEVYPPGPASSADPAAAAAAADAAPTSDPGGRDATAAVYRDVPRPELWFPFLAVATGADGGLGIGPSAFVYGASLLARWTWTVDIGLIPGFLFSADGSTEGGTAGAFDPAVQPVGSASLNYRYGPWSAAYFAASSYSGAEAAAIQVVSQSGTVSRSLLNRRRLGVSHRAAIGTTLVHQTVVRGAENFSFLAAPTGGSYSNSFVNGVSARYGRSVTGAAQEFYGATGNVNVSLAASYTLPLLQGRFDGFDLQATATAFAPGFAPTHASVVELRGFFTSGAAIEGRPSVVQPRDVRNVVSVSPPAGQIAEGRTVNALLHLGYRLPIARVDWPLILSTGILGFSSALYTEGALAAGNSPGIDVDSAISVGGELVTLFGFKGASVPLGLGVNLRLDLTDPLGGDTQIRPYAFFDFALPTETGGWSAADQPKRPEM